MNQYNFVVFKTVEELSICQGCNKPQESCHTCQKYLGTDIDCPARGQSWPPIGLDDGALSHP